MGGGGVHRLSDVYVSRGLETGAWDGRGETEYTGRIPKRQPSLLPLWVSKVHNIIDNNMGIHMIR